ncbi:MAG: DUF3800 domain-containing protein [Candidatus Margulisiibacteriota bacterium]
MTYRLYIDESGDHSYKMLADTSHRFLCLCGIFFSRDKYISFASAVEDFKKKHLTYDADDPPILHRDDIINKRGVFSVLQDPKKESDFNADLLSLFSSSDYKVISVVMDKQAHLSKYSSFAFPPYNYCMELMLERYCGYLKHIGANGDVMAESRGKNEDAALKIAYQNVYNNGTSYWRPTTFQSTLTSKEIKIKPKAKNIAGLQLADLLAHPVKSSILHDRGYIPTLGSFCVQLLPVLSGKFNCQIYSKRIDGYGKVFFP